MAPRGASRHAGPFAIALTLGIACAPIEGTPFVGPPVNACPENPCEAYESTGERTKPSCNGGKCDVGRGLPTYPFSVVVNVPDTSFYAPGRTFVLRRSDFEPAGGGPAPRGCVPPNCVQLPPLAGTEGTYRVTSKVASDVGFPLDERTSLPVRVTDIRLFEDSSLSARDAGLPIDPLFAKSRRVRRSREGPYEVLHQSVVPVGRYLRVLTPEPPYDAYFPPVARELSLLESAPDDFVLGDPKTPLDDEIGDSRRALVRRAEGLAGFRVWLTDTESGRRVSSVRTLSGTAAEARLDTYGQSAEGTNALRDGIHVTVAPPPEWIGLPELRSALIGGQGLRPLVYPALPAPATLRGIVAAGGNGVLTGVPSRLSFTSDRILLPDGTSQPLLHYTTSVSTDASGGFTTILPPGSYDVVIDPAEGTGFARSRERLEVIGSLAKTFAPKPRIVASGRAVLTDGRALGGAEVLALPSRVDGPTTELAPRPARTRTTADGAFTLELDPGQYDLVVDPQAGTGYPRVVLTRKVFSAPRETIDDVKVPPPTRLAFTLRDYNPTLSGNPIVRAVVRVFAAPAAPVGEPTPAAVEVARAMTNEKGECEILLAQQPR